MIAAVGEAARQSAVAAFMTRPASTLGKGETPLVTHSSSRATSRGKGGPSGSAGASSTPAVESSERRRTRDDGGQRKGPAQQPLELPLVNALKAGIDARLKSRNICFFRACGQHCPCQEPGCQFYHQESDIAFGHYTSSADPHDGGAVAQTTPDVIAAYQLFA